MQAYAAMAHLLLDHLGQVAALAQLHLDVQVPSLLPGPVLPHDVPVGWHGRQALDLPQAAATACVRKQLHELAGQTAELITCLCAHVT